MTLLSFYIENFGQLSGECQFCGCGVCDVCQPKMQKHKEMFKLIDDFRENKINKAKNNLIEKFNSIRNRLTQFFDNLDFLPSNCNDLNDYENSIDKMELKINDMKSYIDHLNKLKDENIESIKKEKERIILENNQKEDDIKRLFIIEKSKHKDKYKNINEENKKNKIKRNKIEELKIKKNEIINRPKIANRDFINEKIKNEEIKFQKQKKIIDEKNKINEETIEEYNKEELKAKQYYLNEIQKIKSLSDKIPNFSAWINCYGLTKYLK